VFITGEILWEREKRLKLFLEELDDNFDINWDKAVEGIGYMPYILLNRLSESTHNRDYFASKRIIKSYSLIEKIYHSEGIPHGGEIHTKFLKMKRVFKNLKNTGCYFENSFPEKRSYE
jgi:hypothetical protein